MYEQEMSMDTEHETMQQEDTNGDDELLDPANDPKVIAAGMIARKTLEQREREELADIIRRKNEVKGISEDKESMVCEDKGKEKEETMGDEESEWAQKYPESEARNLSVENRLALKTATTGTLIQRKDGSVVRAGSRKAAEDYMEKYGWTDLDDMRKEAIAHKEMYKAVKGIMLPDGSSTIMDENNPEHVKLFSEQRGIRLYEKRDLATEGAPGYEKQDTVGKYVATDMIYVTAEDHLPELVTKNVKRDEFTSGEDVLIGPRIPVNRLLFDATLKNDIADVERILIVRPLLNVPVKTPHLLSLLLKDKLPIVSDSFDVMRKYTVYIKVVSCRWGADMADITGYVDNVSEYHQIAQLLDNSDNWMLSIEHKPNPIADRKKSGGKKAMRSREFGIWASWLPEWFRRATMNTFDIESIMRKVHKNSNGKMLKDDDLEELLFQIGWQRYHLRQKHFGMLLEQSMDRDKRVVFGDDSSVTLEECLNSAKLLSMFLESVYIYTINLIREMEALILRMNARYVPVHTWEWLCTSMRKAEPCLLYDGYREPAFMYRKQLEAIRNYAMHEDEACFFEILKEGTKEEMTKHHTERKDNSPVNDYDGVSLTSLARLYEFVEWHSTGKHMVEQLSNRIYTAMENVNRFSVRAETSYVPDRQILKPLIDKLDAEKIPNFARPEFLGSEIGSQLDKSTNWSSADMERECERRKRIVSDETATETQQNIKRTREGGDDGGEEIEVMGE